MTQWTHYVDLDWLIARQKYLTASEIKQLLPVTKTGRPRKIEDIDRFKVLASKLVELTLDDCLATGPAARGHILEPYALEAYNNYLEREGVTDMPYLHHWDDCVVSNNSIIAFSPDALDVEQPDRMITDLIFTSNYPTWLGECKCYGTDKHLQCIMTPKDQLEERWQIATAMAVQPTIEHASLIFYDPRLHDSKLQLGIKVYLKEDLEDEIKTILAVKDDWQMFLDKFELGVSLPDGIAAGWHDSEEIIVDNIKAAWDPKNPGVPPCR